MMNSFEENTFSINLQFFVFPFLESCAVRGNTEKTLGPKWRVLRCGFMARVTSGNQLTATRHTNPNS